MQLKEKLRRLTHLTPQQAPPHLRNSLSNTLNLASPYSPPSTRNSLGRPVLTRSMSDHTHSRRSTTLRSNANSRTSSQDDHDLNSVLFHNKMRDNSNGNHSNSNHNDSLSLLDDSATVFSKYQFSVTSSCQGNQERRSPKQQQHKKEEEVDYDSDDSTVVALAKAIAKGQSRALQETKDDVIPFYKRAVDTPLPTAVVANHKDYDDYQKKLQKATSVPSSSSSTFAATPIMLPGSKVQAQALGLGPPSPRSARLLLATSSPPLDATSTTFQSPFDVMDQSRKLWDRKQSSSSSRHDKKQPSQHDASSSPGT